MDVCGIYCVTQLEVWRGGAGGPNKTAIKRYVTFTGVVAANMRKRDDAAASSSAFYRSIISRGVARAPGDNGGCWSG